MILMYHHVCPSEKVPQTQVPLEGWSYHITPGAFEFQLRTLQLKGWKFVTMDHYLARVVDGPGHDPRLAAVTFDDGWLDNHEWALPVLKNLNIPAAFFIVSGPMKGVPEQRRMDAAMLKDLQAHGMTIGAHTRTHPNLPNLSPGEMKEEMHGCRCDLEDALGTPVDLLAYPGGRFSRQVADLAQSCGFRAACSTIPGGFNGSDSRYWLYREVFTPGLNSFRDRLLLHPAGRWIQGLRSRRSVRQRLA